MLDYNKNRKNFARKLRKNQTSAEQLLWHYLRRKQIMGIQFYRQKTLGEFIVDFYAPSAKLVVEIDGSQHYALKNKEADKKRDAYLISMDLFVLRFNNLEVMCNCETVIHTIERRIQGKESLTPHGEFIELW